MIASQKSVTKEMFGVTTIAKTGITNSRNAYMVVSMANAVSLFVVPTQAEIATTAMYTGTIAAEIVKVSMNIAMRMKRAPMDLAPDQFVRLIFVRNVMVKTYIITTVAEIARI